MPIASSPLSYLNPTSGFWANHAKTVPCDNVTNTRVVVWAQDPSASAADATATDYPPTDNAAPLYNPSGINGLPGAFWGSNNAFAMKVPLASRLNNAVTSFSVCRLTGNSGTGMQDHPRVLAYQDSGQLYDWVNTTSIVVSTFTVVSTWLGVGPPSLVSLYNSGAVTAQTIAYGTPYLVESVLNGSTLTVTVNGVSASGTVSGTINADELIIGGTTQAIQAYFYGDIGCSLVYGRVLTGTEITSTRTTLASEFGITLPGGGGGPFPFFHDPAMSGGFADMGF